ncbi:GGDEF domain-containing protein [Butyrivibrio sp. VCB2006]|uniref:GGDEF domain-containing protein n=1 Tax=Butyrivibrio sp. VCB2006 TaxID=1280679 RepID=UPI000492E5D3|nr:GGDEF domain-containing protein [Butyrivibrio sp. VCB2006]
MTLFFNFPEKNKSASETYEDFLLENRAKINQYLNKALWFCVLTGPAIALGVATGVFKDVSYLACLNITVFVVILTLSHILAIKNNPQSDFTSVYALFILDILLFYLAYSHVYLRLTWFLVPLLSLLFCSYRVYFISLIINYGTMLMTTWVTAPFYASHRADYNSVMKYFFNVISGNTIEMFIMLIAGFAILKTTHRYLREQFDMYNTMKEREQQAADSVNTLSSMAGIYDRVNLLNFRNMTEHSLSDIDTEQATLNINGFDHTSMVMGMRKQVAPEQLDSFWEFTNLTTLRERLLEKKSISAEFINIVSGWFRAQYITVEKNEDGIPITIIFTVQNIEKDKQKEEKLIRIAMTDELTRLYNRRSYDDDIAIYRENGLDEDFILLSADVNGLKITNDTKGHAAGDELIKGAADCLQKTIGSSGKVYRTGGDEFIAIIHMDDYKNLMENIVINTRTWHGAYSDSLSISIGFASHKEFPAASVDELERISDSRMYENKQAYYRQTGHDRRKK